MVINDPRYDFGSVSVLKPEALGVPGERTFRLLAESVGSSAVLWLEKEQLFQLALAIYRLVNTLKGQGTFLTNMSPYPVKGVDGVDLEFSVGKLALGVDDSRGLMMLEIYDLESALDGTATLRIWAEYTQLEDLSREAFEVCTAGRAICPLCGGAINSTGHVCPKTNGHHKTPNLI